AVFPVVLVRAVVAQLFFSRLHAVEGLPVGSTLALRKPHHVFTIGVLKVLPLGFLLLLLFGGEVDSVAIGQNPLLGLALFPVVIVEVGVLRLVDRLVLKALIVHAHGDEFFGLVSLRQVLVVILLAVESAHVLSQGALHGVELFVTTTGQQRARAERQGYSDHKGKRCKKRGGASQRKT